MFSLYGKHILVVGGCGFLGLNFVRALNECGADVVVSDLNSQRERIHNTGFSFWPMDVTSEISVETTKIYILAEWGYLDAIVYCVAANPTMTNSEAGQGRLETFPQSQWEDEESVGLRGAFQICKSFGPHMAKRGSGSIVLIASDLSVIAPDQRLYRKAGLDENEQPVKPITYSVIKHGLIGMTKYLASYWATDGVRVNAVSPGGVYNGQSVEFVGRISDRIPMGRMATPEDITGAVVFLCSDESKYMTGQNLVIDGGRSII